MGIPGKCCNIYSKTTPVLGSHLGNGPWGKWREKPLHWESACGCVCMCGNCRVYSSHQGMHQPGSLWVWGCFWRGYFGSMLTGTQQDTVNGIRSARVTQHSVGLCQNWKQEFLKPRMVESLFLALNVFFMYDMLRMPLLAHSNWFGMSCWGLTLTYMHARKQRCKNETQYTDGSSIYLVFEPVSHPLFLERWVSHRVIWPTWSYSHSMTSALGDSPLPLPFLLLSISHTHTLKHGFLPTPCFVMRRIGWENNWTILLLLGLGVGCLWCIRNGATHPSVGCSCSSGQHSLLSPSALFSSSLSPSVSSSHYLASSVFLSFSLSLFPVLPLPHSTFLSLSFNCSCSLSPTLYLSLYLFLSISCSRFLSIPPPPVSLLPPFAFLIYRKQPLLYLSVLQLGC